MSVLILALGLMACGSDDSDEAAPVGGDDNTQMETAGTGDTATTTATDVCESAPVVTWENFGAGFVTENCQACHASTATARNGAPTGVVFDTENDVQDFAERVLRRVIESRDMPPQGGVTDDDRYFVEVWLTCNGSPN